MRSFKTFVTDLVRKPPILLPFVAGAHIAGLVWVAIGTDSAGGLIQVAWLVAYTICWLATCDLRRWGVYGYLALTIANTLLYVGLKNVYDRDMYVSNLFLIDILFSFFLVLYFKKFE
ncbi:hypothetical protein GCM10023093_00150 [Nemorincola caseinilytica]|uniref:Uncharacterized protein n=1 Tax=Nemorincola caseinilytica TaxID=2054315 RepID=A0ABP8N502_9BACT